MTRMALVVGLGVFEDEAVGSLQAIGAFLHTVGSVFEMEALHTLIRALQIERERERERDLWKERNTD